MKQEEIEIKQYIALKRWDATLKGEEYVVKTCPYCEKSDNSFYISAKTGQFRCMRASCGKTGNLLTLKKDLGDLKQSKPKEDASKFISSDLIEKRHNRLKNKPEYLDKLYARGITDEAIDFFRLGFCNLDINGTSTPFLCIPHLVNGVAKNVKYRTWLEDDTYNKADKWRREEGLASVLFNADVLRMSPKRVVLVESELDAISVWCAGEKNVVGLTCGADTFKPEWYDLFDGIEEIIEGLDADIAGFNGAKKIARRLGFNRTKYATWPMKDPNKVLTDMGPEAIMYALSRPEGFEVTGVRTFSQALQRRFSNVGEGLTGIYTPWPSVNKKLGKRGFQDGDLVVLSAPYKTGKSLWSNQWSLWLAENGFPILQVNLEMSVDQLIDTAVKVVRKKTDETIMPIDYLETDVYMKDHPVYYLEDEDGSLSSVDKMFEAMEDAVKRYGIKFIVFDHLHFLVRSLTHTNAEIGIITRRFKSFARKNSVIVCLIAQPRKLNGQRPTADDLKDSVSIATDADCIILMYRERVGQDEFDLQDGDEYVEGGPQVIQSPITEIIFAAARFAGSGLARLYFDGETATFYELDGTQPKLGCFYNPKEEV